MFATSECEIRTRKCTNVLKASNIEDSHSKHIAAVYDEDTTHTRL